jgi:hypothetical protein
MIVELAGFPCEMVVAEGLAESEKSAIMRETVVVCTPELPETVRETIPVGDVPLAVTVRVDVVAPFGGGVTLVGFRRHVVLAGQPLTVSPTGLLNPLMEVTVMVELPALPRGTVSDDGLAEIEKFGVGGPNEGTSVFTNGLPTPVTKSQPGPAEKLPADPEVMSR